MNPHTSSHVRPASRRGQHRGRSARAHDERKQSARGAGGKERTRSPLGVVLPLAREIERQLREVVGSENARIAGSVRRRQETIGDLNFVAAARRPAAVFGAFASLPEVAQIHRRGHAQIRVRLQGGVDADLHVVPESSFGAALICFTGSVAHYRALRGIAHHKNLELNEFGLFRGDRRIAGRAEFEVYNALGLTYVPPELREHAGEIKAARSGELPALIQRDDLRGDLRVYTDGTPEAIEKMACAAKKSWLEYVALVLRPSGSEEARTVDGARLLQHAAAIRDQRDRWPGVRLLAGAEVAIRRDGSLALDDAVLAELDVVTAVVRDHLDQPRTQITRRILRAMENLHVDLLVPPAIHAGDSEAFDVDAVVAAAKRTGTVLEIEARSDGLGLRGEDVRKALDAGVRLAIDSGADEPEQLTLAAESGIALARRGWARQWDAINSLPVWQCLRHLKLKDGRRC